LSSKEPHPKEIPLKNAQAIIVKNVETITEPSSPPFYQTALAPIYNAVAAIVVKSERGGGGKE